MNIKYWLSLNLTLALILLLNINGFSQTGENIPEWSKNVVWYQIFPERFHNGDSLNDPTAGRIGDPYGWDIGAPEGWEISEWTSDWYQRSDWEQRIGPRFNHGVFSRRYGGDLQGVIDKLDYLKELGITAIYFNPVFDAVSLHKYDASYYHHIDRFFGPDPQGDLEIMKNEDPADPDTWQWTSADLLFLELIKKAHERDIRIVIDGVWNHTGRDFWAFKDIRKNRKNSKYSDWYKINEFSKEHDDGFDYEGWWGYKGLPEFTEVGEDLHPEVKAHIFAVTERWMAPDGDVSKGIDGWRLDVAEEVGKTFWIDWHEHVKTVNPNALTIAEIWDDSAKEYVKDDLFGIVMNYRWAYAVHAFFINQTLTAKEFRDRLASLRSEFPEATNLAMQNLMDSHDTERLATMIVNDHKAYKDGTKMQSIEAALDYKLHKPGKNHIQIQKLIALFQYTYPGSPMIFYGTEAGMWGADDPDDRKPMVWTDLLYDEEVNHPFGLDKQRDNVSFNHDLYNYYAKLGSLRKKYPDLFGNGKYVVLHVKDDNQAFAFARYNDNNEFVIILINPGDSDYSFEINPEELALPATLKELLSGEELETENGILRVVMPALSGMIVIN